MKKFIVILFVVAVAMVSCTSKAPIDAQKDDATQATTEVKAKVEVKADATKAEAKKPAVKK